MSFFSFPGFRLSLRTATLVGLSLLRPIRRERGTERERGGARGISALLKRPHRERDSWGQRALKIVGQLFPTFRYTKERKRERERLLSPSFSLWYTRDENLRQNRPNPSTFWISNLRWFFWRYARTRAPSVNLNLRFQSPPLAPDFLLAPQRKSDDYLHLASIDGLSLFWNLVG